jgi:hypothetical protein
VSPKLVRPCILTTAKAIPKRRRLAARAKARRLSLQVVKDGSWCLYSRRERLPCLAEALLALPQQNASGATSPSSETNETSSQRAGDRGGEGGTRHLLVASHSCHQRRLIEWRIVVGGSKRCTRWIALPFGRK